MRNVSTKIRLWSYKGSRRHRQKSELLFTVIQMEEEEQIKIIRHLSPFEYRQHEEGMTSSNTANEGPSLIPWSDDNGGRYSMKELKCNDGTLSLPS
jgi:hypothetical protein